MGPNVVHSASPDPVNNMFWLWSEIRLFWENITATSTGVLKHWSLLSIMSTKTIDTQAIRVLFLFVVLCDSRITTFVWLKNNNFQVFETLDVLHTIFDWLKHAEGGLGLSQTYIVLVLEKICVKEMSAFVQPCSATSPSFFEMKRLTNNFWQSKLFLFDSKTSLRFWDKV